MGCTETRSTPTGKTFERIPRELQSSDRAQTSSTGSGRPSCVDELSALAKSARRRDMLENRQNEYKYTYTKYLCLPTKHKLEISNTLQHGVIPNG